jgi:hypothetical protein
MAESMFEATPLLRPRAREERCRRQAEALGLLMVKRRGRYFLLEFVRGVTTVAATGLTIDDLEDTIARWQAHGTCGCQG